MMKGSLGLVFATLLHVQADPCANFTGVGNITSLLPGLLISIVAQPLLFFFSHITTGTLDPDFYCYECPNQQYADCVAKDDPLVFKHSIAPGSCAANGYPYYEFNDPVFIEAALSKSHIVSKLARLPNMADPCTEFVGAGNITSLIPGTSYFKLIGML